MSPPKIEHPFWFWGGVALTGYGLYNLFLVLTMPRPNPNDTFAMIMYDTAYSADMDTSTVITLCGVAVSVYGWGGMSRLLG